MGGINSGPLGQISKVDEGVEREGEGDLGVPQGLAFSAQQKERDREPQLLRRGQSPSPVQQRLPHLGGTGEGEGQEPCGSRLVGDPKCQGHGGPGRGLGGQGVEGRPCPSGGTKRKCGGLAWTSAGRGAEAETVKGTMGLRPKGSPHVGL